MEHYGCFFNRNRPLLAESCPSIFRESSDLNDSFRPEADIAMSQFPNGLQLAAGNNITHVGTEERAVIASPFKIRKPVRYLIGRRNASLGSAF